MSEPRTASESRILDFADKIRSPYVPYPRSASRVARCASRARLWATSLILIAAVFNLADAEEPSPALQNGKMPNELRVAGAQIPVTRNVEKNVEAITRAIDFAAREKADVLVTPEGSLSGYTHEFDVAATADAIDLVVRRANEKQVALVLGTCFAASDGARYDAQRFYDHNGKYLGFHAKVLLCRHMTEPGKTGELDYFKSAPLRTFDLNGVTVGGLVCNDVWGNPEWTPMADPHLAQQLSSLGAHVVFASVNSGEAEGDELALLRAYHESNLSIRARSAKLWFVVANASDPNETRDVNCRSGVLAPDGHWVVRADPKGEQFFAQTIDIGEKVDRAYDGAKQ
jgi:predicted amidohydrolase